MTFEVLEPSTPRRSEVRRELAVLLKTDLDRIWIRKMETKTGTRRTVGLAHVYEDPAKALQIEPEHIILRNQQPEQQAQEE